MKIIGTDNYNRESIADILIAENIDIRYASAMADGLNDRFTGTTYYKVVGDNYRLSRGMEDLV